MAVNTYSEEFKRSAVKKLLHPNSGGLSITAGKLDLPPSTLFCWRKKYAKFTSMKKSNKAKDWTPEKKLDAVMRSYSMSEEDLGKFLRTNGLHFSDLESFKKEFTESIPTKGRPKLDPEVVELRKENKKLSRDLQKNKDALAEYAARVILLKKSHEIWGTKEDDE